MPKKTSSVSYENNPFFIAVNGMTLLFNAARGMAILLFVFSVLSYYSPDLPVTSTDADSFRSEIAARVQGWSTYDWSLAIASALVIGLAVAMVSALIGGAASYTSAQIAQGKRVTIGQAFRESFERLWSYLWLQIIIFIKLSLWTLLLVLPGIYMAFRYSLAGVAFYDDRKHLRPNAAIKESLRLTKGAWITTFASNILFNSITLSIISNVVTPGVNAILYRQLDASTQKPKPHWLSILTLVVFVLFFIIALPMIFLLSKFFTNQ